MVSKPPWINKGVVGGRPFPPLLRLLDFQIGFKPPCEQSLFLSSSQVRRRKGWLCVNVSSHWSHRSPNVWTDQSSVGLQSNWFAEGEHPFIDKPLITEPAVPSVRLLGLVQNCIPATSRTCSTKMLLESYRCLSRVRQNRASERKALLRGWQSPSLQWLTFVQNFSRSIAVITAFPS